MNQKLYRKCLNYWRLTLCEYCRYWQPKIIARRNISSHALKLMPFYDLLEYWWDTSQKKKKKKKYGCFLWLLSFTGPSSTSSVKLLMTSIVQLNNFKFQHSCWLQSNYVFWLQHSQLPAMVQIFSMYHYGAKSQANQMETTIRLRTRSYFSCMQLRILLLISGLV